MAGADRLDVGDGGRRGHFRHGDRRRSLFPPAGCASARLCASARRRRPDRDKVRADPRQWTDVTAPRSAGRREIVSPRRIMRRPSRRRRPQLRRSWPRRLLPRRRPRPALRTSRSACARSRFVRTAPRRSRPPARRGRRSPSQAPAEDRLAALAMAAEQNRSSTPSQAPRAAPAAPAASSYAPAAVGHTRSWAAYPMRRRVSCGRCAGA